MSHTAKENHLTNKSSQESRRVQPVLVNSQKFKKQRNHRDLTGIREVKRKEPLHIHKSFSFKASSKRQEANRPDYSFLKWKDNNSNYNRDKALGSFFQA